MKIIGLTGGIACGKSTVSGILRELGAAILDADAIYADLVAPVDGRPSPLTQRIAEVFGEVLRPDGELDRPTLSSLVFADADALNALGKITHPAVAAEFRKRADALAAAGRPLIIYDVPLLFERAIERDLDGVIVVWAPQETQRRRLMARNGHSAEEADRRIASQIPIDAKRARATWVIDNSGMPEETHRQVVELWERLQKIS